MSEFRPDLPAREVDRCLRASLQELQRAERNAVLWFAEVLRRKLYRELGYGSIQQYAELALSFGPGKTAQFIRLSEALKSLPRLRASLAKGEVGWTKARTVATVATPQTEKVWLDAARTESRSKLEARVRQARARTRAVAGKDRDRGQEAFALAPLVASTGVPDPVPPPAPISVQFRFTPEQYARYEALMERLRSRGVREDLVEVVLGGLESLAATSATGGQRETAAGAATGVRSAGDCKPVPAASTPYQVHVQLCPSCAGGSVVTGRGSAPLHPRELRAILCDAKVQPSGGRNRAVIPPKVRRTVLERDGFRCRSAGCGRARFLAVHHMKPREVGGSNDPENLITLCGSCHRALHTHETARARTRGAARSGSATRRRPEEESREYPGTPPGSARSGDPPRRGPLP